jgi:hypothetical protein
MAEMEATGAINFAISRLELNLALASLSRRPRCIGEMETGSTDSNAHGKTGPYWTPMLSLVIRSSSGVFHR